MTNTGRGAAAAACVLVASLTQAGGDDQDLRALAGRAVSANAAEAGDARARLRAAGPRGLDALFDLHSAALAEPRTRDERHERVHAAADAVAAQRHAAAAHLYWYTDLEQAKARARETGRPILSLRLLGRLDEELSCANSRFFRTVLYANHGVAEALRQRFVLHWSSERPAPRVTVDFGDGRRLEGTVTGNSIHYVLDAEGRPVDALPGLYGPRAFLEGLTHAEAAVAALAPLAGVEREAARRRHHRERLAELGRRWRQDVKRAGLLAPSLDALAAAPAAVAAEPALRAPDADRLALAKSLVERPLLRTVLPPSAVATVAGELLWSSLAALHPEALDEGGLRRLREDGVDAARQSATVAAFQDTVSEDTVRNEYLLHYRLHRWLAEGPAPELQELNARVYAELFLTPRSDPWLGLVAPNVYTGLRVSSAASN
ncbi:MAG TPA: hypothetical protein VF310_06415 [Vicinamibacteria bacterium]